MYRSFIRRNITSVAIIIFVVIFCGSAICTHHIFYIMKMVHYDNLVLDIRKKQLYLIG